MEDLYNDLSDYTVLRKRGSSEFLNKTTRPTYDASVDRATFIWKDCDGSNQWHLIATGGGAFPAVVMEGNIQAIGGVTTLKPVNIEPAKDILDVTSDPNTLSYHLEIWNAGWDGFDFTVPKNACFTPTAPEGQPVYLGGNRLLLDAGGINLSNLNSCN